MSQKFILILLILGFALAVGSSEDAKASLLTDTDGLDVGLFAEGSDFNNFGPIGSGVNADNLATGYIPDITFSRTLPAPMPDTTEMLVTFFNDSILIEQFLTSGPSALTNGWNMIIEDIEWPDGSVIVGANITSSSFLSPLTVDFTASSVNVFYSGGDTILVEDEDWQATLNLIVEDTTIPTPTPGTWLLFILGGMLLSVTKRAGT